MYDLIIIGGGPAGLTASIYAIRKRLKSLTISKDLGGKTNFRLSIPWAEDYQVIRGLDITEKFKNELEYLDFAYKQDIVTEVTKTDTGFTVVTKSGESFDTKTILIASGTQMESLGVPGEKDFFFKGLCYSAISYAPLFIDRDALVVGEGDLALRSAAELASVAKTVHAVGIDTEMLDSTLAKKLASMDNVTIYPDYKVTKIKGNEFANTIQVQAPDGTETDLKMDGVFVEKSLIPNTDFVKGLVDLDDNGRIKVDCSNRTDVPGVFAAGDVTTSVAEQVLIAIGEGAKAVLSAYDYLLRQK